MPILLTDWIPVLEILDEWYHQGYVPKFIGEYLCNRLQLWYEI